MKHTNRLFCLLIAVTATAGCAHEGGAAQQAEAASFADVDANCQDASGTDRSVRNHFKRARRIGRSSCNAGR